MASDSSLVDAIRLNRRQFLQGLAAVGAAIAIPVSLADATATQVDDAWRMLAENPWFFEVNDFGTLVESGVPEPRVRRDVFECVDPRPRTPEDLIREVESCQPLVYDFQRHASVAVEDFEIQREDLERPHEFDDDGELQVRPPTLEQLKLDALIEALSDEDQGWIEWICHEGTEGMPKFYEIIDRWLDSPVDWDEYEWFPSGWSGQGKAFTFFEQMHPAVCEELGVVIVEGDHPGSSYFAAELHNEIADANAAAERLGLPFRFRPEEVRS